MRDAARDIAHVFGQAYGRTILPLHDSAEHRIEAIESEYAQQEGQVRPDELEEVRELVNNAEQTAKRLNQAAGGWRSEPASSM